MINAAIPDPRVPPSKEADESHGNSFWGEGPRRQKSMRFLVAPPMPKSRRF